MPAASYTGPTYRHVAAQFSPLSGEGARIQGGRWNPPGSYATLYLGLTPQAVRAEFHRLATRQGLATGSFLPRVLYRYDTHLATLLDLRDHEARDAVTLTADDLGGDELAHCQAVGEAAYACGREGILAPSATGHDDILAVFLTHRQAASRLDPTQVERWEDDVPPTDT